MDDAKQTNYNEAIKKIEDNIHRIHDDAIIRDIALDVRIRLMIDDDMCERPENKDNIAKMQSIHDVIEYLTQKWIDQSFEKKEAREMFTRQMAKKRIIEVYGEAAGLDKKEIKNKAAEISKPEIEAYLRHAIDTYMLSDSYLLLPMHINLKIWKSIMDAMIFNIPEAKILECKRSILEKDYLPKVNMENGGLYISINELTTQNDIALVNEEIRKVQKKYIDQYQYEHSKRGCDNVDLDRLIWNYYEQGFKPKNISKKLHDNDHIELASSKASERIKEIKKRRRVIKRDKLVQKRGIVYK